MELRNVCPFCFKIEQIGRSRIQDVALISSASESYPCAPRWYQWSPSLQRPKDEPFFFGGQQNYQASPKPLQNRLA